MRLRKQFSVSHINDTDEELLEYIRQQTRLMGRTPNANEIIGGNFIARRFGGWRNAVIAAGLAYPKNAVPWEKRYIYKQEYERQALAQAPAITADSALSGKFFTQFDDYATDQFPARDFFRSVKANFQLSVLHIRENNDLAVENGYIAKIDSTLNAASLENAAAKLSNIYNTYLKDTNTRNFLAIVPDKGYYFAQDFGYPSADYTQLVDNMRTSLSDFGYIDLFGTLSLGDYYRTDTHWSQDKLLPVAAQLAEALGVPLAADYQTHRLSGRWFF